MMSLHLRLVFPITPAVNGPADNKLNINLIILVMFQIILLIVLAGFW